MAFIEATLHGDEQVLLRLQQLPSKLREALLRSVTRQWFRAQSEVVTGKLSGDPLRRRTGVLASSINVGGAATATALEDTPAEIVGRIGTKVRYGVVHENGGTFEVKAHNRTVTQVFGRAVSPHEILVRAHAIQFPQRSFLRSTLRELKPSVLQAIESDMAKAVQET